MSYNPVVGTLSKLPSAAMQGFKIPVIKSAGAVVAGSFITSFLSKKIQSMIPGGIASSNIGKVATTLLTAGLVGMAAKKVIPSRANELFAGGMISGVTEGLNAFLPASFKSAIGMKGWEDLQNEWSGGFQLDGLSDSMTARQVRQPVNARQPIMHGVGDFASNYNVPNAFNAAQPIVAGRMHGMNEFVNLPAVANATGLYSQQPFSTQGMADLAISEEIEMTM